jgi:hypothetical protein
MWRLVRKLSLGWGSRFARRINLTHRGVVLRRDAAILWRLAGLEAKRDSVPSKPYFEICDPLFVGVELRLLVLHLGR